MELIYDGSMDSRLFKDVLGKTIRELSEQDPDFIYLDADLMSCIGTSSWACEHPDRGVNCGIAEANMVGVACGLAATGFKPVCIRSARLPRAAYSTRCFSPRDMPRMTSPSSAPTRA